MPFEKFSVLSTPEETLRSWQRKLEYLFNKNLNDDNITSTSLTLGTAQVKASNIDFGTGADQVDASDIPTIDAGGYFAAATVEGNLQELGYSLTVTTTDITLTSTHRGWLICNTTSPVAVTLPAVTGNTKLWYGIRNASTGLVTISTVSTDLFDGSTSFDLYEQESIRIVDDGTQWREG